MFVFAFGTSAPRMSRCSPRPAWAARPSRACAGAAAAFDEQLKDHVLSQADARRIKATTRDAVFEYLKTIAAAARRVTRTEAGAEIRS